MNIRRLTMKELIEGEYTVIDPDIDNTLKELANEAWFFVASGYLDLWPQILREFKSKNQAAVDELFCMEFDDKSDQIFERLVSMHPEINEPLREAQLCLIEKKYYAGIPLIFSLSEFIANKIVTADKGKNIEQVLYSGTGKLLRQLYGANDKSGYKWAIFNSHSLNKKFSTLKGDSGINRHAVLHGLDIKYGTRINMLKTLSFLDYVDLTLRHVTF
jgi:hypothetical protein